MRMRVVAMVVGMAVSRTTMRMAVMDVIQFAAQTTVKNGAHGNIHDHAYTRDDYHGIRIYVVLAMHQTIDGHINQDAR